jgi:hypothetical protein
MWQCSSATGWRREVESSSSDTTYTVSYGPSDPQDPYAYKYSCDCRSYKFDSGTDENGHCKHIRQVRDERCGWSQQMDGGKPRENGDGERECPQCGGDAHAVRVAV